jgi:methionyl-tRNA synthetase
MLELAEWEAFFQTALGIATLSLLAVWSLVWKGFALYKAGKQNHPGWFVALFVIQTVGILEILYLAFFSRRRRRPPRRKVPRD